MSNIIWNSRLGFGLSKIYSMYDNYKLKAEIAICVDGNYSCTLCSGKKKILLKKSSKLTFSKADSYGKVKALKAWLEQVYLNIMNETTEANFNLKKNLNWGASVDLDKLALDCMCTVSFDVTKMVDKISEYDIKKFNNKVCEIQRKIKELV
jgi:hypothetical protein